MTRTPSESGPENSEGELRSDHPGLSSGARPAYVECTVRGRNADCSDAGGVFRLGRNLRTDLDAGAGAGRLQSHLNIEGVLLTMYDDRTNLAQQVTDTLRNHFRDRLFRTVIPRNIRLAEAPSHGKPVALYDRDRAELKLTLSWPGTAGAQQYGEPAQRRAQIRAAAKPRER